MFTNGCKNEDEKVLSGYISSDEYFDSSFKDYCKCYYNDSSDDDFINSKFYKSVTDEDINELNDFTDSNDIYGKYHNYDIYYYDTERHILYYFHNNS